MIEVIDGEAGSGKTLYQTLKVLLKEWTSGEDIYLNYDVNFSEDNERIHRFHNADEIFHITKGVLGFDEAQDFFGYWEAMPIQFRNLIAHHRHRGLIVVVNCQSFHDMHVEFRRNTHIRHTCLKLFRLPFKESHRPWLMIVRVTTRTKIGTLADGEPKFEKRGHRKYYFFSKFWTPVLYNTHSNIDNERYLCELTYNKNNQTKKGEWSYELTDREVLMNFHRRR
jgi:hypothetical protein